MMIDEIILGEPIQIDFHLAPWGFIVRITTTNRIKNFVFDKSIPTNAEQAVTVLDDVIKNLSALRDELSWMS